MAAETMTVICRIGFVAYLVVGFAALVVSVFSERRAYGAVCLSLAASLLLWSISRIAWSWHV